MRNALIFFAFFFSPVVYGTNWVPPENPDPKAIRKEAKIDAKEGRHEQALAKHVWYHDNALEIKPSLTGVRLSFALNGWLELAEVYPPALVKMKECRNELEKRIRDENRVRVRFEDFQAFKAFNRTLREEERTVEVFKWLDETDPEDAQRLYGVSSKALIKKKEYALCGKYLDAEKELRNIFRMYRLTTKDLDSRHKQMMMEHAGDTLVSKSRTLVGILVINDRTEEAIKIADDLKGQAKELVENKDLLERLDAELERALQGELPK